jgi:hypothetical protein
MNNLLIEHYLEVDIFILVDQRAQEIAQDY